MPMRPSSTSLRIVRSERTTRAILRVALAGRRTVFPSGVSPVASPPRLGEADCDNVRGAVSMLFPPIDPNEQFRQRRAAARRRKRLRRGALMGVSLGGVALLGVGAQ